MTKLGRLAAGTIIYIAAFTAIGFHTFSLLALFIYILGEKKRRKLLSLIFKPH